MKKIYLLLLMLIVGVGSTWADVTAGFYRLKLGHETQTVSETVYLSNVVGKNTNTLASLQSEGTVFYINSSGSGFTLQVGSSIGKYLTCKSDGYDADFSEIDAKIWYFDTVSGVDNAYYIRRSENSNYIGTDNTNITATNSVWTDVQKNKSGSQGVNYWILESVSASPVDVQYTFKYDSDTWLTKSVTTYIGASHANLFTAPYGVTFSGLSGTVTQDDVTNGVDVTCTLSEHYPFELASSISSAKYYYMKQRKNNESADPKNGYIYYDSERTDNGMPKTKAAGTTANYLWAFVGNPITGYQIFNKAKGTGNNLYCISDGKSLTWSTTATYFELCNMSTADTYSVVNGDDAPHAYFKLKGSSNNTLHDYDNVLNNWNASGANTDAGSIIGFYEADVYTFAVTGLSDVDKSKGGATLSDDTSVTYSDGDEYYLPDGTAAPANSTFTANDVTGYSSRLWRNNTTINVVYNADFDIQSTYSAASAKYFFLMTDRDNAYLNASNLTSAGYIIPTATKHGTTDAVWSFVGSSTSDLAIRNYGTGDSYITAASAESDAGVGLGNNASATYARFNVSPALTTGWWLINVKDNATSYFNKMTNNLAIWKNDNALWGWGGSESSPKDDSDEGSKISITEADMYLVEITGLAYADASKGYVTIGGEQFANGAYYCFVKGATVSADDITAGQVDFYNAGTPVVDATNKKITLAYTATSNIYTVAAGAEATLSEISGYADYDYINVNGKLTIDVEDFDLTKIICASTGELEYAKDFSLSTLPTHKVTISSGATLTIETTFADNHEADATEINNVYGEGTLKVALTGDLSDSGNNDGKYTKLTASNFEGTLEITSGLLQMGSTLNDDATIKLNGGGIVLPALDSYLGNDINVAGTGYIRAYGNVGANDKTLSNTITGTGTIKKTDGGTLKLTGTLTGFTGALDIRKGYVEVASTAKLSDVTIADGMYFCVSNSSTVTIGTAQTAIASVTKHSTTTAQYYKVESGSTIKDNRYHQLTGGSLNVLGTGTMEVYGFCLSSTGKSVSTVNVAANTTLHIIGEESSNTGNSGAFMLSNWPAENVVNIDGTIISKALLSTRDGSPTININNGGTLTMTIGLGIANNGYSSTINTKSGGTLKIGGNHTTNYTTLTVNMEDGSTLTSNANGTTMGQTLTVGDDASVTFSAADGLTLGVQSAITNNGTITTSGTVTLTGALSGAGTINLATFPTSSSKPSSTSGWTGAITMPAVTTDQNNLTDIFNAWGNTSSTINLNNVTGYFNSNETVNPTLNILEGATVTIDDGSSTSNPQLTKVTGAGTLDAAWTGGSSPTYNLHITTLSDFSGTLKASYKPITVEAVAYPNTTVAAGTELFAVSGDKTITVPTTFTKDETTWNLVKDAANKYLASATANVHVDNTKTTAPVVSGTITAPTDITNNISTSATSVDLTNATIGSETSLSAIQTAVQGTNGANVLLYTTDNSGSLDNIVVKTTAEDGTASYTCTSLVLTDGLGALNVPTAFTATTASYERTSSSTLKWGTVCLPYAPATENSGITYYELISDDSNNGVLKFQAVSEPQANVPYLYKNSNFAAEGGSNYSASASSASIVVTPTDLSPETKATFWMVGVLKPSSIVADTDDETYGGAATGYSNVIEDANALYIKSGSFWKINKRFTLKPFRAYITTNSENARFSTMSIEALDDTTTGVEFIESEDGNSVDVIYDINGARLQQMKKGINIVNGKKVVK